MPRRTDVTVPAIAHALAERGVTAETLMDASLFSRITKALLVYSTGFSQMLEENLREHNRRQLEEKYKVLKATSVFSRWSRSKMSKLA